MAGGGNSFSAAATLNGHLSIDANLPVVGKVNFAQMKFEQFKLTTDNPYVDFGNTTFKLASPQHTIGGNTTDGDNMGFAPPASGDMGDFPVTLTNVSPYFADGKIGVKFTMGLTLADIAALPTATTTLSIYGKVKLDGARPKFFFDPGDAVQLDEITVNGDLGAVHIDGKVAFYNNDATYGNGFKGTVTAKFPAIDIGVGSTIQFGSYKGYKYWYVDALVDLGQAGIVLGNTGMSIFGFGGGAYYHMHQSLNLPGASVLANAPKPGSGPTSSGITYTPDVNVSLGLKATILFGLNARPVFNADATMGIEFNAAGGLNAITFNGNGRMLDAPPKPAVIVTLNAEYVFPTSTFSARATAVMDYPPLNLPTDIKGSGSLDIYFAPGKYYIKFGTPSSPIRFPYYMLNNNSFYLEAGNFDIDNMPTPPTDVLTVLRKSNIDISKFNDPTSDGAVSGGAGFIIGGAAGFDYKGQFAIFKADFGATVGFDMALKKYGADADIKCSNGQTSIGQDGWYATGQVYAGVWGNIDISTDFFGDINVLDVGAGAELKGGTPNPTFVTGAIGGYFSVLDGLISGELHYEFSSGQATCDVAQDALSDFKLISDITPSEGTDNSKADVTIEPAVAFNYKLAASVNDNPSFSVLQSNGKDAKNAVRRYFRFNQNCVSAGLTDNDRKAPVASSQFVSQDGKGIAVGPLRTLAKTTNYTFTVSAHLEELINGTWVTAKYSTGAKKGQDYIDTRTVSFKTNKGLDSITDNMVEYTYPLKMQRYFMPEEASTTYYGTGNAVIKVRQVVDPVGLNMPGAESGYEQSFYAKLVPIMPAGAARTFDFSLTADATGKISFALPNDLAANTIYAIQFIGAWTPKSPQGGAPKKTGVTQGAFAFTRLSNLATYRAALGSYSKDTVHNTKLGDKIALKGNEKQLYLIYFKTGTYKKFAEKVVQMPISSLEFAISGAPGADSYTLSVADLDDMKNKGVDLDAYIAGKMRLAAKTVTVNYTKSVYFGGKEYFDNYDILGYNNVKVAEMDGVIYPFKVTPLVSVDNANTVSWLSQFAYTLKSYYKIDKIFGDRTWYNYYTGGATYTLTKMDGKNVGNITLDMINGGVDPVSAYGQVSTFSAPLRSRIGGILRLPVTLPPSYILKAGFEPVRKSGHGLSRPHNGINDIAEFKEVYGGDPAPDALSQIGVVYDLGISTFKQNASVQGGTITATYQLPGSIGAKTSASNVLKAPAISLNFGKMAAVGARH